MFFLARLRQVAYDPLPQVFGDEALPFQVARRGMVANPRLTMKRRLDQRQIVGVVETLSAGLVQTVPVFMIEVRFDR